jgi:hypothetical protein
VASASLRLLYSLLYSKHINHIQVLGFLPFPYSSRAHSPLSVWPMEFYSATKKNEILSFASKWMELENIILSKVSQAQKTKNRMFSLICGL